LGAPEVEDKTSGREGVVLGLASPKYPPFRRERERMGHPPVQSRMNEKVSPLTSHAVAKAKTEPDSSQNTGL
jgi:hypothetical protein